MAVLTGSFDERKVRQRRCGVLLSNRSEWMDERNGEHRYGGEEKKLFEHIFLNCRTAK
jgi:hypothetical protein